MFGAFGNGAGGGGSGSGLGISSLLCLLFQVLADLLHLLNQELRSTILTFRRFLKVHPSLLNWEVSIHGSDPRLPLHTLISFSKSHGSDNEVRMLLTKPCPFEVRNKSFIVLAGEGCIAKFHTNISCALYHFQNVCILPHNLKLVTAAVEKK